MRDINDILRDFDRAWNNCVEQRDKCIEDRKFVDVDGAQWDGACGEVFKNKPRLQFDKITKEISRLKGEYAANPPTVSFLPDSSDAERAASNILNDRYRSDSRKSLGEEACDTAVDEAWKGGLGAWRLTTKYENEYDPDSNEQYICFEPIQSADTVVIFDADARLYDKSDGEHCWVLHEYTRHKFNELWPDQSPFNNGNLPQLGWWEFDWWGDEVVYVAEYYEVVEKEVYRLVFETPYGETVKYFQYEIKENEDIAAEVEDYEQISRERVKVRKIEKALLSGDKFLEEPTECAGRYIPIIPLYGYRSYIKGREYYHGEVRKQRDRQTFNNMAVSMLAELMTESHKEKPIFDPEQIPPELQKEWMDNNVENYPFLRAKAMRDANGEVTHLGAIGTTKAPNVPPAIVSALQYIDQDLMQEMGNGDLSVPSNTSGEAIRQVQARGDMSYYILWHNLHKSLKHCGQVWMSMAKDIYGGVERALRTLSEDGTVNSVNMMDMAYEGGNWKVTNDISKGQYEVIVETGASYSTKLEAERATLLGMLQATDTTSPMYNLILSEMMQKIDGEGGSTIRKVAKYQELTMLLQMSPSLIDPAELNDDEKAYVMEMLQQQEAAGQQTDPMAEFVAAQQEIEAQKVQLDAQEQMLKTQKEEIELQLKSIETGIDSQHKAAQTRKLNAEAEAQELENDLVESGAMSAIEKLRAVN